MSSYTKDVSSTSKPIPNNQWLLDRAACYERRLERGRHLDPSVTAWLIKNPERWALWLEALASADSEGVVSLGSLRAWQWLDTKRKRRYFVRTLADFGVLTELQPNIVKVTA